jgi:hypothetical protein
VTSKSRRVLAYGAGVWCGLMTWSALAQYVLPGRGHALGKLGSFRWLFLINVFPALLCAVGFAIGLAGARSAEDSGSRGTWAAMGLGFVFPISVRLLRPLFDLAGAGMIPALAWCVLGSALLAVLLARGRERQ